MRNVTLPPLANRRRGRLILVAAVFSLLSLLWQTSLALAEDDRLTRRQQFLENLRILSEVYERVYYSYVDELDPEVITEAGILGILDELDEHTQYLPPINYEDLRVQTQGEFGGLGIEINVRDHYPTVISPIEGTPAYYMGIVGGDQIVEIEGESAYDFTSRDAVERLRGEPGTQVNIKIMRAGHEEPFALCITRDIIKVESVPYAFMIDDIGYIRIQNFSQTTRDELVQKVDFLGAEGMRGLILDLRYNPGGVLDAATGVAELFLEEGKLLVFTKGRHRSQNVNYYAESRGPVYRMPMIVLVNSSSASASEIVAAALQDHDAALVAGKTTFGKGSVQRIFPLSQDQALKLTTAHYFTPSGRSIHKRRPAEEEAEGVDLAVRDEAVPELVPEDREVPRHEKEQFQTDMGRIVFGGGGITPDIEIEQALMGDFETAVERDGALFSFASHFMASQGEVLRDFAVDREVLAEFRDFLAPRENIDEFLGVFDLTLSDSLYFAHEEYLRWGIRRECMRRQFGREAAYQVAIEKDEQLHEALALFDEAETLADLLQLASEWNEEQMRQATAAAAIEESPVEN